MINNLTDAIEGVKSDILWAKILVVFLAGPGILLAAYLSRYSTLRLIAAQRRELALLRSRGATPNQVVALLTATSATIALIGVFLGLGVGALTSSLVSGTVLIQPGNAPLLLSSALISLVIGLVDRARGDGHSGALALSERAARRASPTRRWKRSIRSGSGSIST